MLVSKSRVFLLFTLFFYAEATVEEQRCDGIDKQTAKQGPGVQRVRGPCLSQSLYLKWLLLTFFYGNRISQN